MDGFGCRWSKCEASFPSFLSSQSFQSTPSIYWVQTVQQKATESSIWPSSGRTDRNLQVANKFEGFESFTSWTIPMNRTGLRRFEEFVGFEGLQTIGRFGCSLMDSSSKLKIWNSNLRFAIKCEFVYLLHSLHQCRLDIIECFGFDVRPTFMVIGWSVSKFELVRRAIQTEKLQTYRF